MDRNIDIQFKKQLRGKRLLVTGGAGFIGNHLIKQLNMLNADITVLDDLSSGHKDYLRDFKHVKFVKGDIRNRELVRNTLKNTEIIINLAALPFIPDSYFRPEEFVQVNTIGTTNLLLDAMKTPSVEFFVHISSSEVYGSALKIPMDENHPTLPCSTYAVSKLAADRIVFTLHKEHGFPAVILRPFNCYGPRFTQPYIIPEIMRQILNGSKKIVLGNVNAKRDFTYVTDTCRAILFSLINKHINGETINIGSGKSYTIRELAGIILKIAQKELPIQVDQSRFRPYDVMNLICDNRKAKDLLGWEPMVSIEEGLRNTFEWSSKIKPALRKPAVGWPTSFYNYNSNKDETNV